jgi:hypothetical protein
VEVLVDVVSRLFAIAVGYIVLNGLLSHIYKVSGGHWRTLASAYPMPEGRLFAAPSTFCFFEIVELFEGDDDPKGQSWWIIARVHNDGLAIYMPLMPMIGYPPIFIPLDDLRIERRTWRDRDDACAIVAPRTPALSIMIGDTLAARLEALRAPSASFSPLS